MHREMSRRVFASTLFISALQFGAMANSSAHADELPSSTRPSATASHHNQVPGHRDERTPLPGSKYAQQPRIAGGHTPVGLGWQAYGNGGLYIDVDTSSARFSSTPIYFTSIGGGSDHWRTTGANAIYSPSPKGFRVYVRMSNGEALSPLDAYNLGWYINWIGLR